MAINSLTIRCPVSQHIQAGACTVAIAVVPGRIHQHVIMLAAPSASTEKYHKIKVNHNSCSTCPRNATSYSIPIHALQSSCMCHNGACNMKLVSNTCSPYHAVTGTCWRMMTNWEILKWAAPAKLPLARSRQRI